MTNNEKAQIYEECVRESDKLQHSISKIKSAYPINMPENKVAEVKLMEGKINILIQKLHSLYL